MNTERTEILIIGGGVAGLSTACHLAKRGQKGVMLLEREDQPGFYASGHNASVGRQLTGCLEHTAMTIEGRNRLAAEPGLFQPTGGLLLGADPGGTDAPAAEAAHFGLRVERGQGPVLPGLKAAEYLKIPSDGIIDIAGLLQRCAEDARDRGTQLRFGCQVRAIHPGNTGFEVETDRGIIRTESLVNAAGAWAGELGAMTGGLALAFTPLRRHLIWSNAPHPADQPWAWWADRPLYVRPESGGLLLCACEEQSVPLPARGQQPENDEGILENLFASLRELAPSLAERPIARLWCGLRTFSPDRKFVIGRDPVNPHSFWVAGLAGHGMTSGLAVGDLAARLLLEGGSAGPLDPARFLPAQ